jgi:GWxTD domain-containing protein
VGRGGIVRGVRRRRGAAAWRALLAAALVGGACRPPPAPAAQTARSWGEGPVRWLLLPEEQEKLHKVRTGAELAAFLQEFWSRRDDDPTDDEIPFGNLFAERVAAADRLYAEEGVRGSLTDRGGALLLLGPPTILRSNQRRVPLWSGDPPPGARPTRVIQLEVWAWQARDLSPALRSALGLAHEDAEVTITFAPGARRTRLLDGREVLTLAACAVARCAGEGGEPMPPAS